MYDVIVAGAGPAGSSCARECARQGFNTLLIDKDRFPRSKPCGGAVSEQALSYLDFALPDDIIEKECYGARLYFKGRNLEVRKDYRLAVLVSRERFDTFLVKKAREAGAHTLEGERVINLKSNQDHVDVITNNAVFRTRFVVGADGVNSVVAKHVRPPFSKKEKLFAIVSKVQTPKGETDRRLEGIIDIYFGLIPLGYGWVFPHGGYFSVGVGGLATEFRNPKQTLLDFGNQLGFAIGESQGHFIPIGGMRRKLTSHRVLLAGDAAGFVDPFIGEGIAYAIRSGKLAAQSIVNCLSRKDLSCVHLSSYEQACENTIVKDFRHVWKLTRAVHKFPDLFLRPFVCDERILQKYLEVPSCRIHYRKFLFWLLTWFPSSIFTSYARRFK